MSLEKVNKPVQQVNRQTHTMETSLNRMWKSPARFTKALVTSDETCSRCVINSPASY